jgi:hypothetical protein
MVARDGIQKKWPADAGLFEGRGQYAFAAGDEDQRHKRGWEILAVE